MTLPSSSKCSLKSQDPGLAGKQRSERLFALEKRCCAKIVTIEIEEVESVKNEAIVPTLAQIGLECGEIRGAILVLDDELSVDEGFSDGKRLECVGERLAEFRGPIQAASR